jgi:hypothetical protein
MIAKRGFAIIYDQGFFAFEDSGIYLVAKTSFLIMPKGELPIEKKFTYEILLALVNTTMTEYV